MKQLEKLFTAINIGSTELYNRIAMAPMGTFFPGDNGTITERIVEYLEARARGGVGLIITEATTIDRMSPVCLTPRLAGKRRWH